MLYSSILLNISLSILFSSLLSNTEISNPIQSDHETNVSSSYFSEDGIGTDMMQTREVYRELILDNIDYDILKEDASVDSLFLMMLTGIRGSLHICIPLLLALI